MDLLYGNHDSGRFLLMLLTLMDDNPKKMELKYETNPGTNYIASKMSENCSVKDS